ncbi:MAG: hemerythrin domain-containing protein [Acidimicrobiales bacterium]
MDDHAEIAGAVREIVEALEQGESRRAATRTRRLAELFGRHAQAEETGIFGQLLLAGEAAGEIEHLLADHRRLLAALSDPAAVSRPEYLRQLVFDLCHHAEIEETDLFPFALQVLPGHCWNLIGRAAASRAELA